MTSQQTFEHEHTDSEGAFPAGPLQSDLLAETQVEHWQIEIPRPHISFEVQAANKETCTPEKQREPPVYIHTAGVEFNEDRGFHGSALTS